VLRGLGLSDTGVAGASEQTHAQACRRWGGAPDP